MISLRIALRYLRSKKSHNAVNVISYVSIAGVAVATMAIVCVLSVFNGFSELTADRLSIIDPDIKISPAAGKTIANADSIMAEIKSIDGVASAIPVIEEQALAIFGQHQMPVSIKGVPDGYESTSAIASTVIDGDFKLSDGDYDCAVLSVGAALRLGARPGYYDLLEIYVPQRVGRINPSNPLDAFRADSLLVSGVYQIEQNEYDAETMIMPLDAARRMLDYTTQCSAIEVGATQGTNVDRLLDEITAKLGSDYVIANRLMQQASSFSIIAIEKWVTFLILAFVLIIASFNIFSTMSMLIIEKTDNIATLNALGGTPQMLSGIFLWEGWLISLTGGAAGIVIGVILCLAQQWGGFIKLSGDHSQLSITEYPVKVEAGDLLIVMVLVAVIGFAIGFTAAQFQKRRLRTYSKPTASYSA